MLTLIKPTPHSQQHVYGWPAAGLSVRDGFYSLSDALALFLQLERDVRWEQMPITVYGKTWLEPRLTSWMGEPEASYSYSGQRRAPQPWLPVLEQMRQSLSALLGVPFNAVLVNLYQSGEHGVGWHSDDELALGRQPTIASVSLGATRRFRMRHRSDKSIQPRGFDLLSGSLVVMSGNSQQDWQHAVPKVKSAVGPRINLTFRNIYSATELRQLGS